MIETFPKVNSDDVVLTRAELNTGVMLDDNLKYATTPTQKVFSIFKNINIAKDHALKLVSDNKWIECYLYDSNEKLLVRITRDGIENFLSLGDGDIELG